jgi:glycosyltransferase involved in cell wall biosynthesis
MLSTKKNNILEKKWCVIIPTYNNEKTLDKVVSDVLLVCSDVIIVNDGSTDKTSEILETYIGNVSILTHSRNKGKGKSLKDAFNFAINKGFEYAITIDSDGQHYPEDIRLFIDKIGLNPNSIIVGARDMTQDGVPKKSSFGNKFSNFWFWVETGISLTDTQTGFRLYPLNKMKGMRFVTNKFEFEIEVIVRMAWKGVQVKEIPIRVKYDETRVSHFRPFKDFTRISILNTIFFIIAILFYIPQRFLFLLFGKKRIKKIKQDFISQEGTKLQKSLSIGFGAFMGITPIWGFQMIVAVFFAYLFKLNKVIVLITSNISIPPFIPFILFGSYLCGHLLIGGEELRFSNTINLDSIQSVMKQYLIGSFVFAIILGAIFFSISYILMSINNKNRK